MKENGQQRKRKRKKGENEKRKRVFLMLGEVKTEQGEKMSPGEETNGNLCRRTVGRGRKALRQKNEGDGEQKRRAGRTDGAEGNKIKQSQEGKQLAGKYQRRGKKMKGEKQETMKLSNNER